METPRPCAPPRDALARYYAAVSGGLHAITLNAFTQFTEDAALVGRLQKRKCFDLKFIEAGGADGTIDRCCGVLCKATNARPSGGCT